MSWNLTDLFHFLFAWVFFTFLALHHAHMKSPSLSREIASQKSLTITPWYQANYKL